MKEELEEEEKEEKEEEEEGKEKEKEGGRGPWEAGAAFCQSSPRCKNSLVRFLLSNIFLFQLL